MRITLIVLLVTGFFTSPGWTQSLRFPLRFQLEPPRLSDARPSAIGLVPAQNSRETLLRDYFQRDRAQLALLSIHSERFYGMEVVKLSRLDFALNGACAGATLSMFAGAVANTTGLWDEKTSFYLIGAATALGAILGGTVGTPTDPDRRVRLRWDP